ncbi:hypothetical protein P692DRAFT_201244095 [Suillus brevipes Sb2]|nr:hypothetical protein P692DRAFT_201244095 [Suillus brevipes Sb2]
MNSQVELCDYLNDQRRNLCPVSKVKLASVGEQRISLTYLAEPPVLGCLKCRRTLII